jgi:hypothetical protein
MQQTGGILQSMRVENNLEEYVVMNIYIYYICIYIYMYTYMCIYIYIYTYMYISI